MNYHALKFLRETKGLSQAQLEEKSGVSERTIRCLENGHNTSPNKATLNQLCNALCPENEQEFWDAIKDAPDYKHEKKLLDNSSGGQLPPHITNLLNKLLTTPDNSDNSIMYTISCLCGYLRTGTVSPVVCANSIILMNAFAPAIQTAGLTTHAEELETFTRLLICDLKMLSKSEEIPQESADTVNSVIDGLRRSRLTNIPEDRINAVRAAFFYLYDTWSYIQNMGIAYNILSHISILCDRADDTPEMRRHIFYATLKHFAAVSLDQQLASV